MTDGLQIAVKMSSLVISLTGQKNQFTGSLSVKIFKKLFCVDVKQLNVASSVRPEGKPLQSK